MQLFWRKWIFIHKKLSRIIRDSGIGETFSAIFAEVRDFLDFMDKKILAVITARGGSKGVPGKNIKLLGGRPLLAYSIEIARKSRLITDLILSTDDEAIASIGREWGIDVPFLRPAELATDTAGHVDVMQHAVRFMEERNGMQYYGVVILQPTSPFRLVEDIDEALKKFVDSGADSAVSVVELEGDHPIKIKKMEGDRVLPYCFPEPEGVRRQDLSVAYKRSGAVYVVRRSVLMEQGKIFGEYVVGHIIPKERSIDIDTEFDWLKAEYMFKKLQEKELFV